MYKQFVPNTSLTAEDVNDFLMEQVVIVFDDASQRTAQLPTPLEGMHCYLKTTNRTYHYDGSAWKEVLMTDVQQTISNKTFQHQSKDAFLTVACTSSTRPTSPTTGQVIYETDTLAVRVWNGSAWLTRTPDADIDTSTVTAGATRAGLNNYDLASVVLTANSRPRLIIAKGSHVGLLNAGGKASLRLYAGTNIIDADTGVEGQAIAQTWKVIGFDMLPASTARTYKINLEVQANSSVTSYALTPYDYLTVSEVFL